jgi:hypothetical protein
MHLHILVDLRRRLRSTTFILQLLLLVDQERLYLTLLKCANGANGANGKNGKNATKERNCICARVLNCANAFALGYYTAQMDALKY